MRKTIPIWLTVLSISLMLASSIATAQNRPGRPGARTEVKGQVSRPKTDLRQDQEMKQARKLTTEAIVQLRLGLPIYQGHRVNAINICQLAVRDINLGLRWDRRHGNAPLKSAQQEAASLKPAAEAPKRKYSQDEIMKSHKRLQAALKLIQEAQTALHKAPNDYGGYRTRAGQLLDLAIGEINLALKTTVGP